MATDPDRRERYGPRNSDPSRASAARVYDYLLGGSYSYQVDQVAAAQILREFPLVGALAKYNRAWVQRAVRYLAEQCGIRQFLDVGSGIPTAGNVHEIVQAVSPTSTVVYVDYEKVAVDLGREILATNPWATSLHADMREPETIIDHDETRALLDFDKPMAMVWGSMLHFILDEDDPFAVFEAYKRRLKPGDWLAITHATEHFLLDKPNPLRAVRNFVAKYNEYVAETLTLREFGQIMRFFDGAELSAPGLVPLPDWRPDDPDYEPDLHDPARGVLIGGVGRLL